MYLVYATKLTVALAEKKGLENELGSTTGGFGPLGNGDTNDDTELN